MIELIVLDVDGTMTNGQITYDTNLVESKSFDVSDGLAISTWTKKLGKKAAIITGRSSPIVEKRAKDLNIQHVYQGVHNKEEILQKILDIENLRFNQTAAIGDDLNDYKMLKKVGLSFTPENGTSHLKKMVNKVCKKQGGNGAVREMIEYICKENNLEEDFLKAWL